LIRLENIFIKTDENKNLISDVNIFIPSGSIISITGVPGSGKTKLFQVMGLQDKSNKGNLFILGKNINKLNRNELSDLHSEISLVCDKNDLIDTLGVEENIIFPLILTNKMFSEVKFNQPPVSCKLENVLSSKSIISSVLVPPWDEELFEEDVVCVETDESSSEEHASIIGIPNVAKTIGLHAVFKKFLLFFITIFV